MAEVASRPVVLGVERSASGRRWEARGSSERQVQFLQQKLGVSTALAAVLEARGIDPDQAIHFLEPKLRDLMPDPNVLKDMSLAVSLMADALEKSAKIALFGDYDVDGMSSTSMLQRALIGLGNSPITYIPDRKAEGYGPNAPAMDKLWEQGARVLVTIDCGIAAFEPLARAKELGFTVIVLDHHKAEIKLPEADAIVNPNRLDDTSGLGTLCAAGVVFLFLVGLQRELKTRGYFAARQPLDLKMALDLAGLATVCDVVPLEGLNRVFVKQGLEILKSRSNVGLAALMDASQLKSAISASTLGFQLGPRLNAGGRVGNAAVGVELLTTNDPMQAKRIAQLLDRQNEERKALEAAMIEQASHQVAQTEVGRMIFAHQEGWHEGVIGIVAGRLKETYHRPTLVVAWDDQGLGKGSGRSIPGFDLGALILAAKQKGLIEGGGGHAMAAGFSIKKDQVPDFLAFAEERLAKLSDDVLVPRLGCDAVVAVSGLGMYLFQELQRAAPYGQANPEPRLAIRDAQIEGLAAMGQGKEHYRMRLKEPGGTKIKAVAFRCSTSPLGEALRSASQTGKPLHIAGKLSPDTWSGAEAVQFMIDDATNSA